MFQVSKLSFSILITVSCIHMEQLHVHVRVLTDLSFLYNVFGPGSRTLPCNHSQVVK